MLGNEGILHYPKNWFVFPCSPNGLPKKCCVGNFHAVIGHFTQSVSPHSRYQMGNPGSGTPLHIMGSSLKYS